MADSLVVLYEDNHCLAVAKPAPLLTQGVPPGIPTLETMAKAYLKEHYHKHGNVYLGIPHRLDRPVSGVVLFARSSKAARRLAEQFRDRTIRKVYWALVEGDVQPPEGTWEDWLLKVQDEAHTELATPETPGSRQALLHYRRLESVAGGTLLEIEPQSGRMHQIRVQAAARGWPIRGDVLYGSKLPFGPAAELPRERVIALHARSLTFLHPIRYEPLTVTAPLPQVWQHLLGDRVHVRPVLDLKGGQVVRGIAGRREEYRPIVTPLTDSSDPVAVASAFRDRLGLRELYVADLDAIAGAPPALAVYAALRGLGCTLWVDAGLRVAEQANPLVEAGIEGIVAGLETLAGPDELRRLCDRCGDRVVFSLDLKDGRPLGDPMTWGRDADAWSIARQAVALGVRRLLVLDLARVGVDGGTGTADLCRRLTEMYPDVAITAGGGVRGPDDLRHLRQCGVRAALVASALHDGRLTRADLEETARSR